MSNKKIKTFTQYKKKNKKKEEDEEENWQDNIKDRDETEKNSDDTEHFSSDIERIKPMDVEKINPKDWAISQVIDVFKADSSKLKELGVDPENEQQVIKESNYLINAGALDVKIGDILYVTAIIQSYKDPNPHNSMGVLKVRVQDMYKGLHMLNQLSIKNPPGR